MCLEMKEYAQNVPKMKLRMKSIFLIKCSENKVAREQLFQQISQKCKNFISLSNEQKLFWMLNCEDQV